MTMPSNNNHYQVERQNTLNDFKFLGFLELI